MQDKSHDDAKSAIDAIDGGNYTKAVRLVDNIRFREDCGAACYDQATAAFWHLIHAGEEALGGRENDKYLDLARDKLKQLLRYI